VSHPGPTTSTMPENCFVSRLPVPSRQRSSKTGRGRAKLVSFVLTCADHIAAVEAKDTPNRKGQKMQKAKNVTQPDKVKKGACQKKKRSSSRPTKKAKKVGLDSTEEVYYCTFCRGRWGDKSRAKGTEDWIDCCKCGGSFHESCAEGFGILDDDDYTCRTCFT